MMVAYNFGSPSFKLRGLSNGQAYSALQAHPWFLKGLPPDSLKMNDRYMQLANPQQSVEVQFLPQLDNWTTMQTPLWLNLP